MLLNQEENYTKMIAIKNNFYIIKNNSKNTNNKLTIFNHLFKAFTFTFIFKFIFIFII